MRAIARVQADRTAGRSERDDDGARGAAGAEDGDAHPLERDPFLERFEEAVRVGVAADPSTVLDANRVDGADPAGDRVDLVDGVEQRDLEGDRDARAADADRAPECLEVRGGDGGERKIDGVDPRRAERRVVHRGRHRVADRPSDDAVDLR